DLTQLCSEALSSAKNKKSRIWLLAVNIPFFLFLIGRKPGSEEMHCIFELALRESVNMIQ
ncbi:MAG: hypothetical protein V8Q27_06220, partial [Eubacteriales bacterium]